MAQVIANDRAVPDIVRHCRDTAQNAALADQTLLDDAEAYLRAPLDAAKRLGRALEDAEETLGFAQARVRRESRQCDTVLHHHHDALWGLIGRRTRDLRWNRMFLHGVSDETGLTDRYKPDGMRRLAVRILTVGHPKIPEATAKAAAEAIRAAADALAAANAALVPVVTEYKTLQAEYYSNGRLLQIQLSALKKHWAGEGMTDQEIHEIIPDGRPPTRGGGEETTTDPATTDPASAAAPSADPAPEPGDEPAADGPDPTAEEPTG